jgi:hypothetical protein
MTQGILPFQYEEEKVDEGMTAHAGLLIYLDLFKALGICESLDKNVGVRLDQGFSDSQMGLAFVLLNLAGGDCIDDLEVLEKDAGFCRVFRKAETHGLSPKRRRALARRFRRERTRTLPSPSSAFRYLACFHEAEQEKLRERGRAFIPAPNRHLRGLCAVNRELLASVQHHRPQPVATLDTDATLVETNKKDALHCYQHFKAYQPLNVYWFEQDLVVHSEFRDGNVPAGYEQLRVFKEAVDALPTGVEKVRMRSDSAGYQHELLRYCASGENERFGRIEFAVSCDVTPQFKAAVSQVAEDDWHPVFREERGKLVETGREWAEVCFVPNKIGHSKKGQEYRYLATREALKQPALPGMDEQLSLPFQTLAFDEVKYKIFGVVTNMDWAGSDLIVWHDQRCGKSEEAHSVMKSDLAGGKLPSDDFGENSAWWMFMILAFNLNASMKGLALGQGWARRRMKALRFHLIKLPGRVVSGSRRLKVRLAEGHPSLQLLLAARRNILVLAAAAPS